MTFKQLPEEIKKEIREIFKAGQSLYKMRYLLEIYYKNIAPVSDWQKELDFKIGCANCQIKVKRYFERNIKA